MIPVAAHGATPVEEQQEEVEGAEGYSEYDNQGDDVDTETPEYNDIAAETPEDVVPDAYDDAQTNDDISYVEDNGLQADDLLPEQAVPVEDDMVSDIAEDSQVFEEEIAAANGHDLTNIELTLQQIRQLLFMLTIFFIGTFGLICFYVVYIFLRNKGNAESVYDGSSRERKLTSNLRVRRALLPYHRRERRAPRSIEDNEQPAQNEDVTETNHPGRDETYDIPISSPELYEYEIPAPVPPPRKPEKPTIPPTDYLIMLLNELVYEEINTKWLREVRKFPKFPVNVSLIAVQTADQPHMKVDDGSPAALALIESEYGYFIVPTPRGRRLDRKDILTLYHIVHSPGDKDNYYKIERLAEGFVKGNNVMLKDGTGQIIKFTGE